MISLAQFVAQSGGISTTDAALQGELDRCRYLNRALRGRNSVLRPSGRALDIMALDCIDEGFPVTEQDFLEALEADARAWAEGSPRHRVWIDFELSEAELEVFDAEYESWLMERAEPPVCAVCGSPETTTVTHDDENLCETCSRWREALEGEFDDHASTPASALPDKPRAALAEAISFFLTTHNATVLR